MLRAHALTELARLIRCHLLQRRRQAMVLLLGLPAEMFVEQRAQGAACRFAALRNELSQLGRHVVRRGWTILRAARDETRVECTQCGGHARRGILEARW